ncbi:hypothetical protein CYMTET_31696, partial [Cymbomonas tetramitiformis]
MSNEFQAHPVQRLNFDNTTRQVNDAFFSLVKPTPLDSEPYLVTASSEVAYLLDLDPEEFDSYEFPLYFSGCAELPG